MGIGLVGQARGDLDDMAAALLLHFGNGQSGDVKETSCVDGHDGSVVGVAVLGEGLGDEDARVVDERIDTAESGHAFGNHPFGRLRIGDIVADDQDIAVVRRSDRSRGSDHPIVTIPVGFDEGRAESP